MDDIKHCFLAAVNNIAVFGFIVMPMRALKVTAILALKLKNLAVNKHDLVMLHGLAPLTANSIRSSLSVKWLSCAMHSVISVIRMSVSVFGLAL